MPLPFLAAAAMMAAPVIGLQLWGEKKARTQYKNEQRKTIEQTRASMYADIASRSSELKNASANAQARAMSAGGFDVNIKPQVDQAIARETTNIQNAYEPGLYPSSYYKTGKSRGTSSRGGSGSTPSISNKGYSSSQSWY